jgi:hypothetical protein
MKDDLISLDECRPRVGQAFYQQGLIGPASDREFKLTSEYGPEISYLPLEQVANGVSTLELVRPSPPDIANELAAAVGWNALAVAQTRTIYHWLALYGFDPTKQEFNRAEFEAVLAGPLGTAIAQVRAEILAASDAPAVSADGDGGAIVEPPSKQQSPPAADRCISLAVRMKNAVGRPPEVRKRTKGMIRARLEQGATIEGLRAEHEEMGQIAVQVHYGAHRDTIENALAEIERENFRYES